MFVGQLTYEANSHVMADGKVMRDSEAVSTRLPSQRRRRVNAQVQAGALVAHEADQGAARDGGIVAAVGSHSSLEILQRVRGVASAAAKGRSRKQAGEMDMETRQEAAFHAWWCENRTLRAAQAPAPDVSGRDRLAAPVKAPR